MSIIGDVIARHSQEILQLWAEGVGRAAPAGATDDAEQASMMHAYLASLAQRTGDEAAPLSAGQEALIERHLSERLRQGSELDDVVGEFAVLGRCVGRILEGLPPHDRPSVGDIARLYSDLHAAVTALSRLFGEHLVEDTQRAQRCDLLLQRIAGAALIAPEGAVARTPLGEPLAVVMDAMQAQAAALVMFDPRTSEAIGSFSTGIAGAELERVAASVDAATLASLIAGSDDQAAFVCGARAAELVVSPALHESGIHALLGVGLSAGQALCGVLCVGRGAPRAFTPGEVRRLEDLGMNLTMYLDNLRLRAALREKTQSVAHEGELREAFVSVLMHDLTGPLKAAMVGARRLREPWALEEPQAVAAVVVRELDRADWMVRGLLDVHRIRTGQRLAMHVEECDLGAIARAAVEELRASHGHRFMVHADRGVRGIWSAEQLRRAIWNLAVNGIDHGAIGRPVAVSVVGSPGGAEVAVHNEGPEIPLAAQTELFHPFSLPGSIIRGARSGWGLGLTFVWGCMEAHGGRVVVESQADHGTTFRLRLPYDSRPYAE